MHEQTLPLSGCHLRLAVSMFLIILIAIYRATFSILKKLHGAGYVTDKVIK